MEQSKMIAEMVRLGGLMPAKEQRAWVVRMMLENRNLNFADIARKHRLTRWYVASCVNGVHPWSPRVVLALEHSLGVQIRELLDETEAARLKEYEKGGEE